MIDSLVSIILPVYNGEKFLEKAVESCLNQTYKNFEIIIVNDCSTDNSLKIAKEYTSTDQRISLISNKTNKGLPYSLNLGHNKAKGRFLTWTSDDNVLKTNMLGSLLKTIIETESDLVFANYDVIEANGKFRRTHNFGPVSSLPFGSCIGASFLYKREVYIDLGGYDEILHTLEDYDFWLRAAIKYRFYHLEKSLYSYRIHKDNLTSQIYSNNNLSRLFKEKHKIVYKKLGNNLIWSDCTINFLLMIRGFNEWNWVFFKNNYEIILRDLEKFQTHIDSNDKRNIIQMMELMLRNIILNNFSSRSDLLWILIKRPRVFIDPYYSKRTSLKILKKLI